MSAVKLIDILEDAKDIVGLTQKTGEAGLMRETCHIRVQRYVEEERFWDRLLPETILIIASSYLPKLASASSKAQKKIFQTIVSSGIPCIALSGTTSLPDFVVSFSESCNITIFASSYDEFLLESRLIGLLRKKIKNIVFIHGALVNVFGCGIMITGESGTGKTECACRLTERGHVWIADDVVEVKKRSNMLYGRSQDLVKHLIDVKYVGIVNAKEIFGPAAICDETVIDFIIEFKETGGIRKQKGNYPIEKMQEIMGVKLPFFQLPAFPYSRNMNIHVENIVRKIMQ